MSRKVLGLIVATIVGFSALPVNAMSADTGLKRTTSHKTAVKLVSHKHKKHHSKHHKHSTKHAIHHSKSHKAVKVVS